MSTDVGFVTQYGDAETMYNMLMNASRDRVW